MFLFEATEIVIIGATRAAAYEFAREIPVEGSLGLHRVTLIQAAEELASIGDILAKYPQNRIEVKGFTDATGKPSYNEALSLRRAEAVRKVLVERGVKEAQVLAIGMGQTNPVASNATSDGRAKNRRVELHIAAK